MKRTTRLGVLFVLLVATTALALEIQVDYNSRVDFSTFRTFSWVEGTTPLSPMTQDRIRGAVVEAMASRGLQEVADGGDLLVVTHAAQSSEKEISAHAWSYGGWGYGAWNDSGWGSSTVNVSEVETGTLVVDLIDAASEDLVWRGVASAAIQKDPNKGEKQLRKAATRMFKDFPPASE
jgi:hypothetical protein